MAKDTTSNSDRGYGQIAKSALSGLATFGAETGRLMGKGAKAAWGGARRVGGTAKVKASEKVEEIKEKRAAEQDD